MPEQDVGPREISQSKWHWRYDEVNVRTPYFEADMLRLLESVPYTVNFEYEHNLKRNDENNSIMYRLTHNHELNVLI